MSEPFFMRKPKHRKTVVATSKGWVVEETGELLVSIRDLDKKITAYLGEHVKEVVVDQKAIETVIDQTTDSDLDDLVKQVETAEEEQKEPEEIKKEEVAPQRKKPGRKPKAQV